MKGSVEAWEAIWRVTPPGMASRVIRDSFERRDAEACLAGLIRSTFPKASHAAREEHPRG